MKEKPIPMPVRFYKRHRKMIRGLAKKLSVSAAEAVRHAVEDAFEREVDKK